MRHCLVMAAALAVTVVGMGAAQAQPAAAEDIGDTTLVVRSVEGRLAGQTWRHVQGDDVFFRENVRTGADSASQLVFLDRTTLSLSANADLTLDQVVYDPDPGASRVVMRFSAGAMRFVSGTLPSAAYEIRTPTTAIGVRGTTFVVIVAPDGTTTVIVEDGLVTVRPNAGGSTDLPAGQSITVTPAGAVRTAAVTGTVPEVAGLNASLALFGLPAATLPPVRYADTAARRTAATVAADRLADRPESPTCAGGGGCEPPPAPPGRERSPWPY